MIKKLVIKAFLITIFLAINLTAYAETAPAPSYLQAVINTDDASEIGKNTIFDASQSYIPDLKKGSEYEWDFGDGSKGEGIEVLHTYRQPGKYLVKLKITNDQEISEEQKEIFAYRKLILIITDQTEAQQRINVIKDYSEQQGVYINLVDSFGSSTEFISEEVLAKKLNESTNDLQKASQILIWTKENAGLNALSRFIQNNKKSPINFSNKTIAVVGDISSNKDRVQRQFELLNPQKIIAIMESAIYPLIESSDTQDFINKLKVSTYEYQVIDATTGQIRPWNFMAYFVNFLVNKGVPDNTIALLLLLPIIATVVVVMRQFVGITTFGIYTPSIITLSFLIIGLSAGLLTLIVAILISTALMPLLNKVRILFIPKMAIFITIISLILFLILIASSYFDFFNVEFLSLAIFPMLILSTLVEKFISVKTEKGLSSAAIIMAETIFVAIIAYFLVGGEVNLGFMSIQFDLIKKIMIAHPEIVFLLIVLNFFLGKWTGIRLLEFIRFREVLRHIEEE